MKFSEYINKNHPEFFEEGFLDSLAKNKGIRSAVMLGGLAAAGLGVRKHAFPAVRDYLGINQRSVASSRLPGTYEGGIRTSDEDGNPIKLSPQDQKHVDTIRLIRSKNNSGVEKKSTSSSDFIKRKSKSDF